MSVVVAIKENGKVYLGCDSQVTKGWSRSTLKNPNNYKIWKVRGVDNCLMAHVGNVRDANVVRLINGLITDYDIYLNAVDYEFVVNEIVPTIISTLKKRKYIKDNDYFDLMGSSYLFAYKDQLYVISSDGCVIEIDDYVAIGSGEDTAIGSLNSTIGEPPVSRIIKAIKSSATSDIYVDYPIILSDTNSTEFTVVTENNEKEFLKKGVKTK